MATWLRRLVYMFRQSRHDAGLREELEAHRAAQAKGRGGIFADYRLRVASVIRDYGMSERGEAPADSRAVHDSEKR